MNTLRSLWNELKQLSLTVEWVFMRLLAFVCVFKSLSMMFDNFWFAVVLFAASYVFHSQATKSKAKAKRGEEARKQLYADTPIGAF